MLLVCLGILAAPVAAKDFLIQNSTGQDLFRVNGSSSNIAIPDGDLNMSFNNITSCDYINGVDCSNLGGGGGGSQTLSQVLSEGNATGGTDIDLDGANLTDSTKGNVSVSQSLKVHGDIWFQGDSGAFEDQNLSEVLGEGNTANMTIDMDGNDIDNVGTLNSGGSDVSVGGDIDVGNNNITNTTGGNVTIGSDLSVWGSIWVRGNTESDTISEVLEAGNVSNQSLDMGGHDIVDINELNTNGNTLTIGGPASVEGDLDLNSNDITNCNTINGASCEDLSKAGEDNQTLSEVLSQGATTGGTDIDVDGANLTDGSDGNVTVANDLKVYGELWLPGEGNDESDNQTLSEVLHEGNTANQTIDMDGNNVDNIGTINSGGTAVDIGGDFDTNGNNITDSSDNNVTIANDLKVYGELWLPGEGSGDQDNQTLSEVLHEGNTANQTIDMDGNNIDNVGTINSGGTAVDIGGDLDTNGNNITDSTDNNVTIANDLKVYGELWLPGEGSGDQDNQTLSEVLTQGNTANQTIDMDGNNIDNVGTINSGGTAVDIGGDLDTNGNNITDSSDNNVTIANDLKVYGELWLPGEGSGDQDNQTLSEVLTQGNTANQTIDMDGNNIDNVGTINSGGTETDFGGDVDFNGNNLTDSTDNNVTIANDLKVYGELWLPGEGSGDQDNQTLSEVLTQGNTANQTIDMDGNNIDGINTLNSNGNKINLGGDLDTLDENITSTGNVTIGTDVKIYGQLWLPGSAQKSDLYIGNDASHTAGGNLNMSEHNITNITSLNTDGNKLKIGGELETRDNIDMHGNNITDSQDGNVTITQDTKVYGSVYATGADLAEAYDSPDDLEKAEIVSISTSEDNTAVRTSEKFDRHVLGIVSANPSSVMNWDRGEHPIALEGKVPVKVNTENGDISRGDRIAPSSEAGVGMKCEIIDPEESSKSVSKIISHNQDCRDSTVGRALENRDNGEEKILVELSE